MIDTSVPKIEPLTAPKSKTSGKEEPASHSRKVEIKVAEFEEQTASVGTSSSGNMVLYAGLAIGIAALGATAFFLTRSKKQ